MIKLYPLFVFGLLTTVVGRVTLPAMHAYYRLWKHGAVADGTITTRDIGNHNSGSVEFYTSTGQKRVCNDWGVGNLRVGDKAMVTYLVSEERPCIIGDPRLRLQSDCIFNSVVFAVILLVTYISYRQTSLRNKKEKVGS